MCIQVKGVCMQISAINPSFKGRRDNVDAIVALDDSAIRQVAYLKTASEINPKKSKKVTNALFYSAPIAAGLAAAVLSKGGKTKIFSRVVSGLGARAARGLKTAAMWAAALGAIDLLGYGKKKLAENSPQVRKFDREHPLLSIGTMLAAGIGTIMLLNKGAGYLSKVKTPEFLKRWTGNANKFLQNNKTVLNMKSKLLKFAQKTPAALKDIGATALDWAPTALLFGGLFHSINSSSRQNRQYMNNYTALKAQQEAIAKARIRELQVQNDLLMQDAKNNEDIALLNNPLKEMPV